MSLNYRWIAAIGLAFILLFSVGSWETKELIVSEEGGARTSAVTAPSESGTSGPLAGNEAPLAEAGPDVTIFTSAFATFDGSRSYDPDRTGRWTEATPLPLPLRGLAGSGVHANGAIYIFGGRTNVTGAFDFGDMFNTTLRYDLVTERWTYAAPFPGPAKTQLATVPWGDGILVFGGINQTGMQRNDTRFYYPATDTWTELSPTPCLNARTGVIVGGLVYTYATGFQRFCAYDPAMDFWSLRAPLQLMPFFFAKGGAGLAAFGSKVYAIGGFPWSPGVVIYNPATDFWSAGPDSITPTWDMSVAVFQDRIYAIGGQAGGPYPVGNENQEFDTIGGTWNLREPMPTPRDEAAIVAVGDSLHVIGGSWYDHNWQLATHEIYTISLDYAWDFGDGTNATGKVVNHSYSSPGVYTVTLTVTDLKGGVGTDTLTVTVLGNRAPIPNAGGPYAVLEGFPVTLTASASMDLDGDPLSYRWDLDGDGIWDTSWSSDPKASLPGGDNFVGKAWVEVSDGTASAVASAPVGIENVPPAIDPNIKVYALTDFTLRVAGEKFHDVCLDVLDSNRVVSSACVLRQPGSPDAQAATIPGGQINLLGDTHLLLTYTPDDDPINGQKSGATPAWVILTFADGSELRLHHTFNVKHPATWTWTVEDLLPLLVGKPISFEITGSDVGSDDLSFAVFFGDGGTFTETIFNDGAAPDPYPSTEVNPITASVSTTHAYVTTGTYLVTFSVSDDDGGIAKSALVLKLK